MLPKIRMKLTNKQYFHKLIFCLALYLGLSPDLLAQNQLLTSVGNLTKYDKTPSGLAISTTFGTVQVQVYSSTIIRIRASKNGVFDDFTYAVVGTALKTDFKLDVQADKLVLKTDSIQLEISKSPVRFRLLTLAGAVLNEDDAAFGTAWIGEEVTTYKKLQQGERFIGLGEKTGDLNRAGQVYTNYNTDNYAYSITADPLYQTQPFYVGIHNERVYGIFMDNSYKSHFNFGGSNDRFSAFTAEDGEMNYYLIGNSTVSKIIESYTYLTGRTPMPPMWALGLQQSRYTYYPDSEVERIAKTYRDKGIPADAIVLDIHYMDAYKIWTWDKKRFPEPKKMVDDLKALGFNTVVIIDPGIKTEKGYKPYDDGVANGVFTKYPDGTNFTAAVWPGWCHFPDFTNPKTRTWWGSNFKDLTSMGVQGFWNDMNEPASWGGRFPDLVEFDFDGHKATQKRAHNLYGFQMVRATYEGTRKLLGKRPFVLTRAGYSGVQRYSAVWTGDNRSEDNHMMAGVRLLNSMGLSGVPFVGTDVGGFTGGASSELFARWVSIGAFSPFFRIHSAIDTKASEPWSYGERVEAICKSYIKLRYRLLPTMYSSFYEAATTGVPIQRTLAINYTHDYRCYDSRYQNQFLFGNSILVAPLESTKEMTKVFLPGKSGWYDMYNDVYYAESAEIRVDAPLERLPIFIKGGGIIAMQSDILHTGQKSSDTLTLHVYNGNEGSTYVHYEDDGSSFDNEKGISLKRTFTHNPSSRSLMATATEGSYGSKWKYLKVVLHGYKDVKYAGAQTHKGYNAPMPSHDPTGVANYAPENPVYSFVIANSVGVIEVKW